MAELRSRPLDALSVLVVVDNETDTLSSIDPGVPQLPEIATHLLTAPTSREHAGLPAREAFSLLCCACHGFSALVTGEADGASRTVLFDVGPSGEIWLDNARKLGVDLAEIDAVFLSHWHADHSGGLPLVVAAVAEARRDADLPPPVVDLHPDRPDQRGVITALGVIALLPPEPLLGELEAVGGDLALHAEQHLLGDGRFLGSGEIPRVTAYETGLAGHVTFVDGEGFDDPLIRDERFLAMEVTGRGVTVLSACSHAGIVNACLHAQDLYPDRPIDLVLGGFHLAGGSMEGRIPASVSDLRDLIQPRFVAPGHCTGWRAKAALAATFAPGRYAPSAVGTQYALTPPA